MSTRDDPQVRAVLFDMDGTLTEPMLDWAEIRRDIGVPPGIPVLEYMEQQAPEAQRRMAVILDRHEELAARSARPNVGIRELFDYLGSRGVDSAVVTRNSRSASLKTLDRIGVSVKALVTRENGPPKPDPAPVLLALEKLRCNARNALMVGDYKYDILAGKAAGARTVLLRNGNKATVDGCEPDFVVTRLDEIVAILESLT